MHPDLVHISVGFTLTLGIRNPDDEHLVVALWILMWDPI